MIQQLPTRNGVSGVDAASENRMKERAYIRQLVTEALTLLNGWSPLSVSSATLRQYGQTSALMARQGRKLEDASCKATFYRWRAAEVFARKYELDQAVIRAEQVLAMQESSLDLNIRTLSGLENRIQKLRELPPGAGLKALSGPGEWTKLKKKCKKKRAHLGKRKLLGKLPVEWMDMLWHVATTSKYRDVVAVLALSGCRPCEIQKGVSCHMEAGSIVMAIEGAKTGQAGKFGQSQRKLTFPVDTAEAAYLAERCGQSPWGELYVKLEAARAITDIMRTWSIVLWPERPNNRLTPYVYRQAAFARYKTQWSPEKVAQAMGQSSDRTQQRYGMRSQAGRGAVPSHIWGSNPVKVHASANTKQPKAKGVSPVHSNNPASRSGDSSPSMGV